MSNFIGRGEKLVERIISRLFIKSEIQRQVPIKQLVHDEDFIEYDEEFAKHKCDLVIIVLDSKGKTKTLVIEVNYKHKEKAAKKWRQTFAPDIKRNENFPITINDYDCRSSLPKVKGIFYLDSKKNHGPITWNDVRDVIDHLDKAGVEP